MERSVMSAANLIGEAAKSGVWIGLYGDKLALRAPGKPPDALIARLKTSKPEIIALLRQAACAVRPAGYTDAEWLAAVADADRLGYPPREVTQ
jgi:TubC N-terminal docking domain